MGGKSKAVTVSFWYKLIALLGWCKGPIDALLEIRGGDRPAWQGFQDTSGIITVDKPDLYGGETAEGGIQGDFEVMMGEPDQEPNAYMIEHFGPAQPGRRGKAMILLRGPKIGAGNPYPKALYFKLQRIFKGWDIGECWYPEKAQIGGEGYTPGAGATEFLFVSGDDVYRVDSSDWNNAQYIGESGGGNVVSQLMTYGDNMLMWQGGVAESAYTSTDAGATWTQLEIPGVFSLVPRQGYVDADGTFWLTDNSYAYRSTTFPAFENTGDAAVYVVGTSTFLFRYADYYDQSYSINNGVTWTPCATPLLGLYFSLVFASDANRVAALDLSYVDYTLNFAVNTNGSEWVEYFDVCETRNTPEDLAYPMKMLPFKGKWVAFLSNKDIVYGDLDDWELSDFIAAHRILDAATDGNTIYAVSDNGYVISSTDALSWTVENSPEDGGLTANAIAFRSEPGTPSTLTGGYMNAAHIIYDAITSRRENGGMGEPVGRINDDSFRAAADIFYNEGMGLCCTWYGGESARQFIERVCTVAGCTLSQSSLDGMYYLFPMREVEDVGALPVIRDDDIIEFEAEPALPPESINRMQVKWFDPETREERITPPVHALGAIEDAGGVLPEIREYFEIPYEALALRVAQRDLQSFASALWRLRLVCTARLSGLQKGQQARLMAPLRGFADMIVHVADVDESTLDGPPEVSFVLLQDVFSLPSTSFVDPQPGLGPGGVTTPENVTEMRVIESPYVELAASMTEADLQLVRPESGYLVVGATQPGNGTQYELATKAEGEEFERYGNGDWTPSATIVEAAPLEGVPETEFTFEDGSLLDRVATGTWALWGDEMCRVDALDIGAGTVTLGRSVGDTVPQAHVAGERVYFIGDWYASDLREYADGEEVTAKAMNRTGLGVVALESAPSAAVTMASRQARPYPPGRLRVSDAFDTDMAYPTNATGTLTVSWAHRDRLLQADQLFDEGDGSIGPEPGVTYTVRAYLDDVLDQTFEGLSGTSHTFDPSGPGVVRVEVESVRGSVTVESGINGGFEDATPAWTPDAGNTGGGTFSIEEDPAIARTGDKGLMYEGVPGADGVWTEEDIICGADLHPNADLGAPINFGAWCDVTDVNAGSQILVVVRPILQMRAVADDSLLGEYAPSGEDTVIRGWGKLEEGWQLSSRRITYGHVNGFQVYFRPVLRVRSIPQGTPPAGFTVRVDDFYADFEGTVPDAGGVLTSWQAATAEFNYTPLYVRTTDSGDTRITDSGDTRIRG